MAVDVCVVGSANLDVVVTTARHPSPGETVHGAGYGEFAGGKGLNQAVAAARSGATTAFVGAVGDDAAGRALADVLRDEHIDATWLSRVSQPTGRAVIVVDRAGENSIVVVAGANAEVRVTPDAPIADAAVALCQLEIPAPTVIDAFRRARAADTITVLNPAPAGELTVELLELCDIIVPNEHEVELVGGVEALLSAGCRAVIVTRGAAGVEIHTNDHHEHIDAYTVDVVDTTGAGDAFCGSLSARLASGDDLVDAVRWATAAGALATTRAGGVPAQPAASAIRELMRQHDG